jgi:hypothetical protein
MIINNNYCVVVLVSKCTIIIMIILHTVKYSIITYCPFISFRFKY